MSCYTNDEVSGLVSHTFVVVCSFQDCTISKTKPYNNSLLSNIVSVSCHMKFRKNYVNLFTFTPAACLLQKSRVHSVYAYRLKM